MVAAGVVVLERGVEVYLARGEEEEDDDDELKDEDVGEADADGEAVGLRGVCRKLLVKNSMEGWLVGKHCRIMVKSAYCFIFC